MVDNAKESSKGSKKTFQKKIRIKIIIVSREVVINEVNILYKNYLMVIVDVKIYKKVEIVV